MTRTVLFHFPTLNVGGAEKSSLRMMRALCDRGWSVTLVLTTGGGALEPEIDPRVGVVRLRPRSFGGRFVSARGAGGKLRALPDLLGYAAMRLIGIMRMIPFLFRRYDAAAVLLTGTSSAFVRRIVRARVRAVWIRNDLSQADHSGRATAALRKAANDLDYFICVSEVSRKSLVTAVPEADDKDVVIYNILDADRMVAMAGETAPPFPPSQDGTLNILSVCRLSDRAKGLRRMARVCRALKDKGLAFHWWIAGSGPDQALLEAEIETLGIQDRMSLLGVLPNPFPAYRAADIVAMLSNYEGLCGVINEARVLGKPVIATRVSGIDEQLVTEENGLIVEQDDADIIAGMTRMLTDAALRDKLAAGGYPDALLDDAAKLNRLEALFLGKGAGHE